MGSGAAGPSGVKGRSPLPSMTDTQALLAAFTQRANAPLARRQIDAGTEFALGRRDGPYIWNLEGTHRLLDCATTGGVHSLGHRHPELLAALQSALDQGYDAGIWTMPNAPLLALHDALAACAPEGLDRSVVTLCASQANDLALLCAQKATGRRNIIAFAHGYHGHLGLAAAATGSSTEGIRTHFALNTPAIRFFQTHGDLSEIETLIDATTAAVIIEPFDYETWRLPPDHYLPALAELCRHHGAKLILDETRTGLMRSGQMWMCNHTQTAPDMLVAGKGLSGGLYPVGALLMTQEIHEACINSHEYGWANSLAGNEIAATVALKVLEIAQRPDTGANIAALESRARQRFAELIRRHQSVFAPATILGGIATIGLVQPAHAARLSKLMFNHGVLMHSVSTTPPHVAKFLPVLTANTAIIDELADALDQAARG
jgi:putrescine aminotransferase